MEYGSWKASLDVLKPRNIYIGLYMYIFNYSLITCNYSCGQLSTVRKAGQVMMGRLTQTLQSARQDGQN
jgi:hypothetical protein